MTRTYAGRRGIARREGNARRHVPLSKSGWTRQAFTDAHEAAKDDARHPRRSYGPSALGVTMPETPNDLAARKPAWRRFLPLAVLAAAMAAAYAAGLHRYLSFDALVTHRETLRALVEQHYVYALLLYGALYVAAVALSLPGGLLLTISGGFLFGWLVGGCAAVLAATLGATLVFLIARSSLGETLAARAGPALTKLADGFKRDAVSYMLFLRLVPAFPFWLVNLAAAVLGVPLRAFVATTLVGIMPATFAFAVAGAGLDSAIAAQGAALEACLAAGRSDCPRGFNPGALATPELIAAFVALGLVALIPVVARRWKQRSSASLDGGSGVA